MTMRMYATTAISLTLGLVILVCGDAWAQPPGGGGRPSFEDRDSDGDGKISKSEFRGPDEFFTQFDADNDGFITKAEFEKGREAMRGRRGGGRGGEGRPAPSQDGAFFQSMPQAKDVAEKQILGVLDEMDASGRRMQSVPMDDGRFLRLLAESTNAQHVVEIGTSQGFSAIWFCLALRRTGGKLTTFEIDPDRAELAKSNFEKAGVSDLVTLVLGDAHEEVVKLKDPIDILFLDADKQGYVDYLNKLLPQVRPGGLIVAHNITPSMADPDYVAAITGNPELESLLVNLQAGGISVTLKKR